ncbi:hypothetical protein [Pedobacter nyackensis]|uniref:N-acyl-D-glucosamine 2-epimerase n=1 Tax=Pedobacter nyackensis TaxID=475255 RepID=A0A1W2F4F3_9SPHI|nr:hypothetical protein [Pedobacter nyackensis]SMD16692.1 hypothetical protein SAMN04488101_12070 [Pedobacter nyackensis]
MSKAFISILICSCFLFSKLIASSCKKHNQFDKLVDDVAKRKRNALKGPSIQFSPGFAYYLNRSKESLVEEIELAGYKTVHYFITNENVVDKELVKAFQKRNIAVWAMVLGNGTYSTDFFPKGWEKWKVKFIAPYTFEGFTFLSPFSKEYLGWKKQALGQLLKGNLFDGIEFAEAYLPGSWEEKAKASHGDVSENAVAAFQQKYHRRIPDFFNKQSPDYFKTDTTLYNLWVNFRVDGVNSFLNELVNGKGGVRESFPDIFVATWSLGIDAGPKSVDMLREHNGLDVPKMIQLVRPDIHFIQTHYPDWIKSEVDLSYDYFKAYGPFFREIRDANKTIPIGLQADIGSVKSMIKSGGWFKRFLAETLNYGYSATTAYEYNLGGYIYKDKPLALIVKKQNKNDLMISFNKRIDAISAGNVTNYRFIQHGKVLMIGIKKIITDGNRIKIITDRLPAGNFELELKGIEDTPRLWYYKGYPANRMDGQKMMIEG